MKYLLAVLSVLKLAVGQIDQDKFIFPNLPLHINSTNNFCNRDSKLFLESVDNLTLWAQQMWDASAKSATGVLQGNAFQMGDYDECMKVEGPFRTKFCLATIIANVNVERKRSDPLSLYHPPGESVLLRIQESGDQSQKNRHIMHVGLCVPAACSRGDLKDHLSSYLGSLKSIQNVSYGVEVSKNLCQKQEGRRNVDFADIGFCTLTIVLLAMVALSTVYDLQSASEKNPKNILLSFSVKRNFSDLTAQSEINPLSSFHGIKVFAICMVVIVHRFAFSIASAMVNFDYVEEYYRNWTGMMILHAEVFVDTFFTLSGTLTSYSLLIQFEKKVINPALLIALRFLRLTPSYAFCVFFASTLLYHLDSGPLWEAIVGAETVSCRKNWWANLLYVNNYVDVPQICGIHTWYMPCEFHFSILGTFLVLFLHRNKKFGFILLTSVTIMSIVAVFVVTFIYKGPAFILSYPEALSNVKTDRDFNLIYVKSHMRASPYLVGLFTGYLYYKWNKSGTKLSTRTSRILAVISWAILITTIGSGAIYFNPYHNVNLIEAGLYAAFYHGFWAIGTSGLLLSCSHGSNKWLHKALSWAPFQFFSKLSYGIYLSHMFLLLRDLGSATSPAQMSVFKLISASFGDIVKSSGAALFLYLTIEGPFKKFTMLITPKK